MSSDSQLDEKHADDHPSKGKHTAAVHYVDMDEPPRLNRFDTFPTASRASSIAGTDDEDSDDDYDWSGEEDLVDEEAKFEQAMGVKKKQRGWGCARCAVARVPLACVDPLFLLKHALVCTESLRFCSRRS